MNASRRRFSIHSVSPSVVAELRHRQIEIAVAVEVAGAHVGDARDPIDDDPPGKGLPPVVLEHHHRADPRVARKQDTETGYHDVEIAVTVEIDRIETCAGADLGEVRSVNVPAGDCRIHDPIGAACRRTMMSSETVVVEIRPSARARSTGDRRVDRDRAAWASGNRGGPRAARGLESIAVA